MNKCCILYKYFKLLKDLKDPSTRFRQICDIRDRRLHTSTAKVNKILFEKDCIFCNKVGSIHVKVARSWVHQSTSLFDYGGGQTVIDIATSRKDECLITRIYGQDLFAREAHYHPICRRRTYTSDSRPWYTIPQTMKTLSHKLHWRKHMTVPYRKSSWLSLIRLYHSTKSCHCHIFGLYI